MGTNRAKNVKASTSNGTNHIFVERTLAIIKPDAVPRSREIIDIIIKEGFNIVQKRKIQLTPEQASEFYAEHYNKEFFPKLISYMTSGPVMVMVLTHHCAISQWRELMGPTNVQEARSSRPESIRARFGSDKTKNAVHGSDRFSSAEREIRFFFARHVVQPVPVGDAARDYLDTFVNPLLLTGLTELCKKKPQQPMLWLSQWLMDNNPNQPKMSSN